MELDQKQKCYYICQFCNQIFSNGGGYLSHIRGHVALFSGTQDQSIIESSNDETDEENVVNAYGLREHPKKPWRVLNSKQNADSICKQCEKEFNSVKSFPNHIRTHLLKSKESILCTKCYKGFDSVKALHGHMRRHSIKKSQQSEDLSYLSSEDWKTGVVKLEIRNVIRRKRSCTRYNNHANPNNNPSSSFAYHEAEGGALGLMMLSRGLQDSDVIRVKNVISTNHEFDVSVDESTMSSKNTAKSNLRSTDQDVRDKGKRMVYDDQCDIDLRKSKDYKCSVCFKEFGSGQALEGHTSNKTGLKKDKTGSFKVRRRLDFDGGIENDNDDNDSFDSEVE